MLVSKYFVFFIFYSFLGWIYESCYCTIQNHYWQNRGFLYGPIVPIYGVGATAAQILFHDLPIHSLQAMTNWQIFFICAAGSFVMEYVTSFVLEKLFHARWWDYSKMPLNINGRVCLIFTACFGLAGVVIVNFLIPPLAGLGNTLHPLSFEIISLIFMLLFGMDLALTVSALTSFAKEFERINEQINQQIADKYTALESNLAEKKINSIEKIEAEKEAHFVRKELTQEKLAEIKEQLSAEYVRKLLLRATEPQRGQLRHIIKFSHPVSTTQQLMEKGSFLLRHKKKK